MKRMSVLMAVAFVDMIGLTLVLPLLALYALKMQADATTIGFLTASFPVAQLIASPVWGRVSDRYGRRPALLVGLAASALEIGRASCREGVGVAGVVGAGEEMEGGWG